MSQSATSPPSDEATKLSECKETVKQQAYYMKRALDQKNLRVALQHAATMLGELRTAALGPKNYYDLYITVTSELRHMEQFFSSEHERGRYRMQELYEKVQYAGHVLPRLYLLLAVGAVYIGSKEAPAKDILKDLVEMCRGVQHPMRGLFLRNYLSQVCKDKLPDVGSDFEGVGGSVDDAVSFILTNFAEMNKLWVRMQHQGPVSQREKRERERSELKILVGTNLLRLSQLDGVTVELYQSAVLQPVLEQVVNCKDAIAQQYLMECITQVFPVEYHSVTLPPFLKHCGYLAATADVNMVLLNMMDRLGGHTPEEDEAEEASVFSPVCAHVGSMIEKAGTMSLVSVLQLHKGLATLALKVYPERLAYVDRVFEACADVLSKAEDLSGSEVVTLLREVCSLPLVLHSDVLVALELGGWPGLCAYLAHAEQKKVVSVLVSKVSEQGAVVSDVSKASQLLTFVSPLLRDGPGEAPPADDAEQIDEDLALELAPVSRMIHALRHEHTDDHGRVLNVAYKHATAGTERRSPFVLVPLIFQCLSLCRRIKIAADAEVSLEVSCHKLLSFVARMVEAVKPLAAGLSLRLFLQCAQTADACGEEEDAYEFMTQAFVVYEEDISDSRAQLAAINLIAATLASTAGFDAEHYETLCTKTTQHSAKLLKKPDQSRAVCVCSKLFWSLQMPPELRKSHSVLHCLQRALKIADQCKVSKHHTQLFVEALESYLWHFGQGNEQISATHINSLIQLIEQGEELAGGVQLRFENQRAHIAIKAKSDERYAEIA